METSILTKPVFELGDVAFCVSNCDADFLDQLALILPRSTNSELSDEQIFDARMGCTTEVRPLLNHMVKRHTGHLWINAACLVSPRGQKVLISGAGRSGKTTLSLLLIHGFGWRMLAEDVTVIDPGKDEIISFVAPFSVKKDTAAFVKDIVGRELPPVILGEWIASSAYSVGANCPARFDFLFHLEGDFGSPLSTASISSSSYLQKNFKNSNLVRLPGATDKFVRYSLDAPCFTFEGGGVPERFNKIVELCGA